jgi:phosphoglycolate phosphatase
MFPEIRLDVFDQPVKPYRACRHQNILEMNKRKGNVKLVIFDLDGTLVDFSQISFLSTNYALENMGLQTRSFEELMSYPQKNVPYDQVLDTLLGKDRDESTEKELIRLYQSYFTKNHLDNTFLLPEVFETLQLLEENGISIALATRRPRQVAFEQLERFRIKNFFEAVVAFEDTGVEKMKPDPASVDMILEKLEISPENCVLIGDSPLDAEAGKAAGIKVFLLLTGPYTEEVLASKNPDGILQSLADLRHGSELVICIKKGTPF